MTKLNFKKVGIMSLLCGQEARTFCFGVKCFLLEDILDENVPAEHLLLVIAQIFSALITFIIRSDTVCLLHEKNLRHSSSE